MSAMCLPIIFFFLCISSVSLARNSSAVVRVELIMDRETARVTDTMAVLAMLKESNAILRQLTGVHLQIVGRSPSLSRSPDTVLLPSSMVIDRHVLHLYTEELQEADNVTADGVARIQLLKVQSMNGTGAFAAETANKGLLYSKVGSVSETRPFVLLTTFSLEQSSSVAHNLISFLLRAIGFIANDPSPRNCTCDGVPANESSACILEPMWQRLTANADSSGSSVVKTMPLAPDCLVHQLRAQNSSLIVSTDVVSASHSLLPICGNGLVEKTDYNLSETCDCFADQPECACDLGTCVDHSPPATIAPLLPLFLSVMGVLFLAIVAGCMACMNARRALLDRVPASGVATDDSSASARHQQEEWSALKS